MGNIQSMADKISAKQKISIFRNLLELPGDDDPWYYVKIIAVANHKVNKLKCCTILPMIEWIRENKILYWDYAWNNSPKSRRWGDTSTQDNLSVYFRFTKPEDATLFKLTWAAHLAD